MRDIDSQLEEPVTQHCLGGFVLRVVYDIPRYTADLDYLEVIPSNTKNSLESIGGPESALAKKHKLFLHFTGVIDMPEDYE